MELRKPRWSGPIAAMGVVVALALTLAAPVGA